MLGLLTGPEISRQRQSREQLTRTHPVITPTRRPDPLTPDSSIAEFYSPLRPQRRLAEPPRGRTPAISAGLHPPDPRRRMHRCHLRRYVSRQATRRSGDLPRGAGHLAAHPRPRQHGMVGTDSRDSPSTCVGGQLGGDRTPLCHRLTATGRPGLIVRAGRGPRWAREFRSSLVPGIVGCCCCPDLS